MSSTIPRFLLPQRSSIWKSRTHLSSKTIPHIRNASNKPPSKLGKPSANPLVLEKPTKFNPPSHGAKLKRDRPRYPGPPLSSEQKQAQATKKYPNMMPPPGTFMHWFLHSRSIHLYITLGTLISLAGYTAITSFKHTSPFASMLPGASDLLFHPIASTRLCLEVLRLHTAARSAETAERRKQHVDDVQKRSQYRKAHGLDTEGFGGWSAKEDGESLESTVLDAANPAADVAVVGGDRSGFGEQAVSRQSRPLKKWLGIW